MYQNSKDNDHNMKAQANQAPAWGGTILGTGYFSLSSFLLNEN
jgi:hypothetical protein